MTIRSRNKNNRSYSDDDNETENGSLNPKTFPFFNKKLEKEIYGEPNHYQSQNSSSPSISSILRGCLSFFSLIFLVVFITFLTSYAISQYSPVPLQTSSNPIQNMLSNFKSDLKKQREYFSSQNTLFRKNLDSLLEEFQNSLQTKFASKSYVDDKFVQLERKLFSLSDSIEAKIRENSKNVPPVISKDLDLLKQTVKKISVSMEGKLTASIKLGEKLKRIETRVAEMEKRRGNFVGNFDSSDAKKMGDGKFVTAEQFSSQIKAMEKKLAPSALRNAMIKARDGDRVDWALQSSGGRVLSVVHPYSTVVGKMLSRKHWEPIRPVRGLGDCLPLKKGKGAIVIGLRREIVPSGFSYESVNRAANPTSGSAPKRIRVRGIVDGGAKVVDFGVFEYRLDGPSGQSFDFEMESNVKMDKIRFEFEENYGNEAFTCVYRLRVFGTAV